MWRIFIICTIFAGISYGQLIRSDFMNIGIYNPKTGKYEKPTEEHSKKHLLGGGDHDLKKHSKHLLGADDHDFQNHAKHLLGGDDHDLKKHSKHHPRLLGSDGHDLKKHFMHLLGSDGHDLWKHRTNYFGRGDHDLKPHSHKKDLHQLMKKQREFLLENCHNKLYMKKISKISHLDSFIEFANSYNKRYSTCGELLMRVRTFGKNLKKIRVMNHSERGSAVYGVTKFADWTHKEFRRLLGLKPHLKPQKSSLKAAEIPVDVKTPKEFDWRKKGVVTPVKNQGMCGSCWAFSVTGNVEGQWAIKHNKLYSLSEQELVDCDKMDEGCNGGLPENAYKAIEKLGGLETEDDYPYDAEDEKCHFVKNKTVVQVDGAVELPQDEDKMKEWLYTNGPISIGINANALQFYVGGVSHPLKFLCNPKSLDHGMLIVGYGVHKYPIFGKTLPFWIVKNSWGERWGEQGYYRVYRGDGTCGVNMMATSAQVP